MVQLLSGTSGRLILTLMQEDSKESSCPGLAEISLKTIEDYSMVLIPVLRLEQLVLCVYSVVWHVPFRICTT